MPETFRIKLVAPPRFSLELSDSFNNLLQNESLEQIRNATIQYGKSLVPCCDLLQVEDITPQKRPAERIIEWEGDFSRVHGIGRGWQQGRMQINGNTGDCLGERMSGGEIIVIGNAADAAGCSMSGGRIVIEANAADRVGSPASGELRGMSGGEIFVLGNAGDSLGMRMRRGTIVVQKNVGENVGIEMLAGSILLFGGHQGEPGLGMKRGSIILLQGNQTDQSLGYQSDFAVTYQPVFLRALLKHLEKTGHFQIEQSFYSDWYDRYSCDMAESERGEILVRASVEI